MRINYQRILYGFVFFCGLLSQILSIELYRTTFVPFIYPLFIYISTGLFAFAFLGKFIPAGQGSKIVRALKKLVFSVVTIGGISSFCFLSANFYFANKEAINQRLSIIKKGTLGKGRFSRCSKPYVVVEKDEFEKEIIFECQFAEELWKYRWLHLSVSKGGLGFDIIRDKRLDQ